eukprot:GHVU01102334.1.p1 GENE.GHVU01102334.1~~GHVU01102334.1.p1  ORF type:complete len:174 (+),score=15.48 GHVU01102334.1:203-724(+)
MIAKDGEGTNGIGCDLSSVSHPHRPAGPQAGRQAGESLYGRPMIYRKGKRGGTGRNGMKGIAHVCMNELGARNSQCYSYEAVLSSREERIREMEDFREWVRWPTDTRRWGGGGGGPPAKEEIKFQPPCYGPLCIDFATALFVGQWEKRRNYHRRCDKGGCRIVLCLALRDSFF